jgi:hypothetical protein
MAPRPPPLCLLKQSGRSWLGAGALRVGSLEEVTLGVSDTETPPASIILVDGSWAGRPCQDSANFWGQGENRMHGMLVV